MSPFTPHILVFNPKIAWTTVGLLKTQLMWKVYGIQFIRFFLIPNYFFKVEEEFVHCTYLLINFNSINSKFAQINIKNCKNTFFHLE